MNYKRELDEAIEDGDLTRVRQHFELSDLASDEYEGSLLHSAAEFGTLEIVEFLVESGADIDRRGGLFNAPPLTYAALRGKLDIVRYLLGAGSVLDIRHTLRNPLLRAAARGHVDVVSYLLTTEIDPHATYRIPTGALTNALVEAEQSGHKKVAELLKAHGCRKPVEGVDKPIWEPPADQMVQPAREVPAGSNSSDSGIANYKLELQEAIEDGDLAKFRESFELSDLASDDYDGSLLHSAATFGTLETVKFLVENGAEINRRGGTYRAPAVTYAADNGKADITRYLFEHGSVLDTSHALRNPLLRAAAGGHLDVVSYLLTTTIDPHATYRVPTGELINALVEAEQGGHKKVAELLKAHGCRRPVEGVDKPIWEPPADRMVQQAPESDQYQQIIDYMQDRFGPVDPQGQQSILSPVDGLSIVINIIRPNDEHPYLVLFTNGMSLRPMKVPPGQEAWQYAELVMHLPADWRHPRDADFDPQWLWPIRWLREMAYYPHQSETWLGLPAAIVSSADPPEPLGPNTQQTCLLLVPDFANLNPPLQRNDGGTVHFFTMVPLYTEERDYELKHGMKAFFERFIERRVPMTVDVKRAILVK